MSKSLGDAIKVAAPIVNANTSCCAFGWIGDKHEEHFRTQPCHYEVKKGSRNDDVKFYYTTISGYDSRGNKRAELNLSNDDLLKYPLYLLGENSPFKSFIGDREREVIRNDDGLPMGMIIATDPKDDLDNLFAFSIAGRYTNEKLPGYSLMLKLIASGLHPTEAWYITHFFCDSKSGITKSGYWAAGHTNFDNSKIDLKRLVEGNPHPGKVKVNKGHGGGTPTAIARFWPKDRGLPDYEDRTRVFAERVKPTNGIVGRWSNTKGSMTIDTILKGWETYREELLTAAA